MFRFATKELYEKFLADLLESSKAVKDEKKHQKILDEYEDILEEYLRFVDRETSDE